MRGFSVFLAVVLAAAVASAAEPIVLFDVSDGAYVLRVSGSQVSLIPARSISPVGPVIPPDGPVVPPVIPAGKAAAIKAAAEAATADPQRATTASNLARVMGLVRSQIDAGTLKEYQTIGATLNWFWDQVTVGRTSAWLPCKTLIGQHLDALAQQGARPEEYSGYSPTLKRHCPTV